MYLYNASKAKTYLKVGQACRATVAIGHFKMEISYAVPFILALVVGALADIQLQHPEEWHLWKAKHGKSYNSQLEELEKHLTWLSNREYIKIHNVNSDKFGFTLAMNHFGDLV